jgi:2-oxoglutarate dehydrogenase E1 component
MAKDNSFLEGDNALFLESLYALYLKDPESIDPSWRAYFLNYKDEAQQVINQLKGASWSPRLFKEPDTEVPLKKIGKKEAAPEEKSLGEDVSKSLKSLMLIEAYRHFGHLQASLDPLNLNKNSSCPELDYGFYGFTEADLDKPVALEGVFKGSSMTLKETIVFFKQIYSSTIGFEYMHIQDPIQKEWLQQRIEKGKPSLSNDSKLQLLNELNRAESFEKFLQVKFPGAKRFGLEGGESFIPTLKEMIKKAVDQGAKEVILGMAHRGRLNVIANIIEKPLRGIFYGFLGKEPLEGESYGSGDVKYHLGFSNDRDYGGNTVHISLTPNPSHLESVDPVVLGKVRAKQDYLKDQDRSKVLGILIHGDAALAGQGVVSESLILSNLKGYKTGGTVHIVINNQIGFTSSPPELLSSTYCTDIVKSIQAPIFHINGDDPEACIWAAQLALEFKNTFKKDVVIDLVCYRRYGHNEMDEPSFTQPVMYNAIASQPSVRDLYFKTLVDQNIVSEKDTPEDFKKFEAYLQSEFQSMAAYDELTFKKFEGRWKDFDHSFNQKEKIKTGVALEQLHEIGKALIKVPENFTLHPKIPRLLNAKEEMFGAQQNIDWATGEALAFGSLLCDGVPVRLSGQDCIRGTFTQRHAAYFDYQTNKSYIPLNYIQANQAFLDVINSPLSEAAVLGFELGYTYADPYSLVLWEGQFGDFANGAQVIIDQYLSAGEQKWGRLSGLAMLLPHSFDGQGPEHSSARLERYLQLCAQDNLIVANCSTPASYFHILRRQMFLKTRKPLIIMTPKTLLRHKKAVSSLEEMASGTFFKEVISETNSALDNGKNVRKLILCTGKVYYDLIEEREKSNISDIAIVRIEQLYPFPEEELINELKKYPEAKVVWCQEEPQNMGAWHFIDRRLESALQQAKVKNARPSYVGRTEFASPATGYLERHSKEQATLVKEALTL